MAFAHTIHRKRLAQSLIDYVFVVGIVAAALIAMQAYIRRGVQAGVKVAADELGSQTGLTFPSNYTSTGHSEIGTGTDALITETAATGGTLNRDIIRESSTISGTADSYSEERKW